MKSPFSCFVKGVASFSQLLKSPTTVAFLAPSEASLCNLNVTSQILRDSIYFFLIPRGSDLGFPQVAEFAAVLGLLVVLGFSVELAFSEKVFCARSFSALKGFSSV